MGFGVACALLVYLRPVDAHVENMSVGLDVNPGPPVVYVCTKKLLNGNQGVVGVHCVGCTGIVRHLPFGVFDLRGGVALVRTPGFP